MNDTNKILKEIKVATFYLAFIICGGFLVMGIEYAQYLFGISTITMIGCMIYSKSIMKWD